VRRHIPAALYLGALTALIFALARPEATIPVPSNTGTVILAIDVSGSMLAEDVNPNRMEAAKDAVKDFVNKQPKGVKIGVVSFSDYGALVAPATTERRPVLDAVSRLRPQRGTNIGGGLQAALEALLDPVDTAESLPAAPGSTPTPSTGQQKPAASIVLLSDGQSTTGPQPLEIAEEAAAEGVRVYTIGIGTPEGTVVRILGRNQFTRLDEGTLQAIADETGGKYYNAQDESDLREIYDELARERQFEDEETEITFIFAAVALLISIVAGGLGLVWFNRLP
jgi:Ca-activated chloride channel family protein